MAFWTGRDNDVRFFTQADVQREVLAGTGIPAFEKLVTPAEKEAFTLWAMEKAHDSGAIDANHNPLTQAVRQNLAQMPAEPLARENILHHYGDLLVTWKTQARTLKRMAADGLDTPVTVDPSALRTAPDITPAAVADIPPAAPKAAADLMPEGLAKELSAGFARDVHSGDIVSLAETIEASRAFSLADPAVKPLLLDRVAKAFSSETAVHLAVAMGTLPLPTDPPSTAIRDAAQSEANRFIPLMTAWRSAQHRAQDVCINGTGLAGAPPEIKMKDMPDASSYPFHWPEGMLDTATAECSDVRAGAAPSGVQPSAKKR